MANFSISIKNPYGVKDYESVKKTYDWIIDAVKDYSIEEVKSSFLFDVGDITCSVDSIEEFTENAYGMEGFFYNSGYTRVIFESGEKLMVHIYDDKVTISSNNKTFISEVKNSLIDKQNKKTSTINHQYNIFGDKNNVAIAGDKGKATVISNGSHNTVNSSVNHSPEKRSGFIDFLKGIGTNIVSNIIWILLGAFGASVVGVIVYYVQRLFSA